MQRLCVSGARHEGQTSKRTPRKRREAERFAVRENAEKEFGREKEQLHLVGKQFCEMDKSKQSQPPAA